MTTSVQTYKKYIEDSLQGEDLTQWDIDRMAQVMHDKGIDLQNFPEDDFWDMLYDYDLTF